ncbi:MAG: response regulator transcription factor [Proteobacteria bacterium]|nr:response regulator transcription factor [Pseudomonadota bacterium]MBU1547684.1 response regulator transcription factor [Pseudomonadota bacterium]MBU2619191.1 response regulator transcription factor [Pseudomonadota bacterium]
MGVCRIVLADDHALIRHGVKKMIEQDPALKVVGEAADGLELIALLKTIPADLVILDISMPNLRGIEAIREVRKICPAIRVLMLTMHKGEQYLCSSFASGADGYLLKEDSDTELLPAIARVRQGELYISPNLAGEFPEDVIASCSRRGDGFGEILTPREKQILQLVAEGVTSRDIADKLDISKRTVEHHRANMMKKLNIKRVADLIKYAIGRGLSDTPPE